MKKKFLLFLVEGKNDEREIGAILHAPCFDQYREKYQIQFLVNGNDITATTKVTASNIQGKLNDILMHFRRNGVPFSNIRVDEIQEFVQIVDMDGAFISPENIVKGNGKDFIYTSNSIITSNTDGAIGRNKKKADILRKLSEISQVGNVPYSVYYASCNMDHVLFDNLNPSSDVKTGCAYRFIERCASDPLALNESIFKQGIMAEGTYADSWVYIQQDCNSLHRHTNINLFFSENAKNKK
jgi:hypothetical protein